MFDKKNISKSGKKRKKMIKIDQKMIKMSTNVTLK